MFKVENFVSLEYLTRSLLCRRILPGLAVAAMLGSLYLVFIVVPNERVMGAVQRTFYFHVGSASAAYAMIAVLFFSSVFFLYSRKKEWDQLAEAAGSVGLLFCTVVLGSGMVWGHSAWNTWWRWEPRLVSFLILWLILFAYVLLRSFSEHDQRQSAFCAVLGVLAAVNVPIVVFSVKFLDHAEQLHPQVMENHGLKDPSFVYTLAAAILTVVIFSFWLLGRKLANVLIRAELNILKQAK